MRDTPTLSQFETHAKFHSLDNRDPSIGAVLCTILRNLKMVVNVKDMYGTLDKRCKKIFAHDIVPHRYSHTQLGSALCASCLCFKISRNDVAEYRLKEKVIYISLYFTLNIYQKQSNLLLLTSEFNTSPWYWRVLTLTMCDQARTFNASPVDECGEQGIEFVWVACSTLPNKVSSGEYSKSCWPFI